MKNADNIKRFMNKASVRSNPNVNKAVLSGLTDEMEKTKQSGISLNLRRIIMKSPITKLAAAAVIVAAVLSAFFYTNTKDTYAVEQTIEAMRKVTAVHCFINTFAGERIELWIKVNPETGSNEKFYIDGPEEKQVATPVETYTYNKKTNVVRHSKGSLAQSDIRLGRFIEDMVNIAESLNGKIEFKQINPDKKKPAILITIETDKFVLESIVDRGTKLPTSMNFKPKGKPQPGQTGQSIEEITYHAHPPEGIFEFKIPEGAQVIEQ